MTSQNRCKLLSESETRELLAAPEHIARANERHDMVYGLKHDKVAWRVAYQPASPKLDRESIFKHHRAIDEAKGIRISTDLQK